MYHRSEQASRAACLRRSLRRSLQQYRSSRAARSWRDATAAKPDSAHQTTQREPGRSSHARQQSSDLQGARHRRSEETDYPTFELRDGPGVNPANVGRKVHHGLILKVIATNICGSDQHMVRGRTTTPPGLVLGHEITGEVVETGRDVEFINVGDWVSVPFNIACGRCRNCKEGETGVCLNVNPDRPRSAYGYVDMGGWPGGQAEYARVPHADWNCLKFPDKEQSKKKILDLAMLTDIFPTGYHGVVTAGAGTGSTVYIAGRGQWAWRQPPRRSCSVRRW
jgi:glutathione-independent formaldehyde dehydrogenase